MRFDIRTSLRGQEAWQDTGIASDNGRVVYEKALSLRESTPDGPLWLQIREDKDGSRLSVWEWQSGSISPWARLSEFPIVIVNRPPRRFRAARR